MDAPISLEDLCYLHIICHLEHYPLHNLSKLSYPVRRRLLQNLPASDIIELENTCMTDGIGDFENEIWKQSCVCQSICVRGESRQYFLNLASNYLFGSVAAFLLSSVDKYLREIFFSVPECLGITDLMSFTSVACDDEGRLVPHRYAALFDHSLMSLSELHARVVTSLNKAGFKPTKITTNGRGFAIDLNSGYISDLSVLLSAVDTVELLAEENQTTLPIIKAICMNKSSKLRSFWVCGDNYTQMCLSFLLERSVFGLEKLHCSVPTSGSGCNCLIEFISSQTNIKELEFSGSSGDYEVSDSNYCMRDQCLQSCVGNLIMRPDFELYRVHRFRECMTMTQCAFSVLLSSFLSAPASRPKKVTADNFDVQICECYAQKAVTPCIVGDNSLEYKEASFTGNDEVSLLDQLLECLSNFEIQLKHLAFESFILQDITLFTAVFSSPSFTVREVHLYYVGFPKLTSESDFHILDGLLSKPSLKVFELSGLWANFDDEEESVQIEDELKVIANALTKQASVGTLESFIYEEFEASLYGIDGIEEFVRAMLCLPQFLQLNFSLQYPSELADMANEFWVECANGRTLKPPPPNCRNSLLEVMLGIRE